MVEQETKPLAPEGTPAPESTPLPGESKKKFQWKAPKWNKIPKKHLTSSLCICLVAVGGLQGYGLFFGGSDQVEVTSTLTYGQIGTLLEGSGSTTPTETQVISVASTAEILGVYVTPGETVQAGQLLYIQDDSGLDDQIEAIYEEIETHQDTLSDYQDSVDDLRESVADATVTAPFSGKVWEVSVKVGDNVSNGSKMGQITDSSTLNVVLYFSYAYESDIWVGQTAQVSVPEQMLILEGTVTKLSKVEYITKEGTRCFGVTISLENPGSLVAETAVSATIGDIYPVEAGVLDNQGDSPLNAAMSGTVSAVYVENYQNVSSGTPLFSLDTESLADQIADTQEKMATTQEKINALLEDIEEIHQSRSDYQVYSEIAGRVISVNVKEGQFPNQSTSAVMIYNLDTMELTANIDELDIPVVSLGMEVTVQYSSASTSQDFVGTISAMSYEASNENGVAYFPVTITVDSQGALSSGVNVSYQIAPDDSAEGYLVPIDALKEYEDGVCVYIQGSSSQGLPVEDVPKGYYAQAVTVETTNAQYALVAEGLEEDMVLFHRYQATSPSGGDSTSSAGGNDMEDMMAMREEMMASGGMTERPNSTGNSTGSGMSGMTRPGG